MSYEPKYQVGDIIYNSYRDQYYLIEKIITTFVMWTMEPAPKYLFTNMTTGKRDTDYCYEADRSRNLTKVE